MSGYPGDLVFSSHRLLYPQRRVGKKGEGRFERVSWDEALDDVARRLKAIVAKHGPTAMLPSDLAHSRLILVWGANPAVSNEHGWDFALEAKRKGARIVVVDPLRSRTVQDADQHVQPIPGTDAALALGLMPSLLPGGSSANALTPDGLSDRGGGSDFHDARVEVDKA